ncbi:MAG: hypothetical protein MAG551_02587 [Candidatus Scalindua arabica]|uniref:Uncharacterized protein n=1 Tax=Candidatus Scalindua arabica TaxID=1127984 RepID=A0A942A2S5_9BACT|nr:hypothetical protein [Candidatus Scalindua arabica]
MKINLYQAAKDYVNIIEEIEKTKDSNKLQSLEERVAEGVKSPLDCILNKPEAGCKIM